MINFKNVTKLYDNGIPVIKELNLQINQGELFVLIGPSGCGKTTTMKMINRLIEPTSGTIEIGGEDIAVKDPVELRRSIGYVIQQIGLFPHMTIEQNVSLVPRLKKIPPQTYLKKVDELLAMVGLDPQEFKKTVPQRIERRTAAANWSHQGDGSRSADHPDG